MFFRQLRAEQPEVRAAIYNQIHRKQQYPIRKTARKEQLKLQGIRRSEETAATVKDDEKVSGSGTSKSDTSDTTASSSADSKNADSTVKKNSSTVRAVQRIVPPQPVTHKAHRVQVLAAKTNSGKKTAPSSGASNAGTKPNKAADSSTAASNTTSQSKSEHTHTWVKYVANTIQHKEGTL